MNNNSCKTNQFLKIDKTNNAKKNTPFGTSPSTFALGFPRPSVDLSTVGGREDGIRLKAKMVGNSFVRLDRDTLCNYSMSDFRPPFGPTYPVQFSSSTSSVFPSPPQVDVKNLGPKVDGKSGRATEGQRWTVRRNAGSNQRHELKKHSFFVSLPSKEAHKEKQKLKGSVMTKKKFSTPQVSTFFNFTFDKGRLKNLVSWTLENYGQYKTVELLEQLKKTGFEYATKAGISLGIDDLKIPPKKKTLLLEAEQLTKLTVHQYQRADITAVERFQRLIDTWHRTSEQLKQEVITYFEETDILNPVYMMAFSGARGNISQVRQLVGMRGLMSDPQGQIIDFPIRSNFREGLTLTEYIISSYGARKGIVDTALRTANAGYLTRRLVDVAQHVIISHYDCGTQKGIFLTDMKEGNKTIVSAHSRIIGRVLARDIYKPNSTIKIASRNQEISTDLAFEITKITNKIFVRSSLTCNTTKLLCQLCYGWSLAQGNLVSVGEAVGVIAAQSIGEPGTQLTMRTFHTGGVFSGDVSDEIRAPYHGFVHYAHTIPGILIRALDGKILFLTKSDGTLIFSCYPRSLVPPSSVEKGTTAKLDSLGQKPTQNFKGLEGTVNLDIKKYKIPAYTVLFVRNGESVDQKQVVAQITSISTKPNMRDTAELVIKSELEGLFYAKNIQVQKKVIGPKPKFVGESKENLLLDPKAMEIVVKARGWNFAWVLSGKRYEMPLLLKSFPLIGDYITPKTVITRHNLKLGNLAKTKVFQISNYVGDASNFPYGNGERWTDYPPVSGTGNQGPEVVRNNKKGREQLHLKKVKKVLLFNLFLKYKKKRHPLQVLNNKIKNKLMSSFVSDKITFGSPSLGHTPTLGCPGFPFQFWKTSPSKMDGHRWTENQGPCHTKGTVRRKTVNKFTQSKAKVDGLSSFPSSLRSTEGRGEKPRAVGGREDGKLEPIKIKQDLLFLNLQKIKYHKLGYFHFFNSQRFKNIHFLFLPFVPSGNKSPLLPPSEDTQHQRRKQKNKKEKRVKFNYNLDYNNVILSPTALKPESTLNKAMSYLHSTKTNVVGLETAETLVGVKRVKSSNHLLQLFSPPTNICKKAFCLLNFVPNKKAEDGVVKPFLHPQHKTNRALMHYTVLTNKYNLINRLNISGEVDSPSFDRRAGETEDQVGQKELLLKDQTNPNRVPFVIWPKGSIMNISSNISNDFLFCKASFFKTLEYTLKQKRQPISKREPTGVNINQQASRLQEGSDFVDITNYKLILLQKTLNFYKNLYLNYKPYNFKKNALIKKHPFVKEEKNRGKQGKLYYKQQTSLQTLVFKMWFKNNHSLFADLPTSSLSAFAETEGEKGERRLPILFSRQKVQQEAPLLARIKMHNAKMDAYLNNITKKISCFTQSYAYRQQKGKPSSNALHQSFFTFLDPFNYKMAGKTKSVPSLPKVGTGDATYLFNAKGLKDREAFCSKRGADNPNPSGSHSLSLGTVKHNKTQGPEASFVTINKNRLIKINKKTNTKKYLLCDIVDNSFQTKALFIPRDKKTLVSPIVRFPLHGFHEPSVDLSTSPVFPEPLVDQREDGNRGSMMDGGREDGNRGQGWTGKEEIVNSKLRYPNFIEKKNYSLFEYLKLSPKQPGKKQILKHFKHINKTPIGTLACTLGGQVGSQGLTSIYNTHIHKKKIVSLNNLLQKIQAQSIFTGSRVKKWSLFNKKFTLTNNHISYIYNYYLSKKFTYNFNIHSFSVFPLPSSFPSSRPPLALGFSPRGKLERSTEGRGEKPRAKGTVTLLPGRETEGQRDTKKGLTNLNSVPGGEEPKGKKAFTLSELVRDTSILCFLNFQNIVNISYNYISPYLQNKKIKQPKVPFNIKKTNSPIKKKMTKQIVYILINNTIGKNQTHIVCCSPLLVQKNGVPQPLTLSRAVFPEPSAVQFSPSTEGGRETEGLSTSPVGGIGGREDGNRGPSTFPRPHRERGRGEVDKDREKALAFWGAFLPTAERHPSLNIISSQNKENTLQKSPAIWVYKMPSEELPRAGHDGEPFLSHKTQSSFFKRWTDSGNFIANNILFDKNFINLSLNQRNVTVPNMINKIIFTKFAVLRKKIKKQKSRASTSAEAKIGASHAVGSNVFGKTSLQNSSCYPRSLPLHRKWTGQNVKDIINIVRHHSNIICEHADNRSNADNMAEKIPLNNFSASPIANSEISNTGSIAFLFGDSNASTSELQNINRILKIEKIKKYFLWVKNKKPRFLPKQLFTNFVDDSSHTSLLGSPFLMNVKNCIDLKSAPFYAVPSNNVNIRQITPVSDRVKPTFLFSNLITAIFILINDLSFYNNKRLTLDKLKKVRKEYKRIKTNYLTLDLSSHYFFFTKVNEITNFEKPEVTRSTRLPLKVDEKLFIPTSSPPLADNKNQTEKSTFSSAFSKNQKNPQQTKAVNFSKVNKNPINQPPFHVFPEPSVDLSTYGGREDGNRGQRFLSLQRSLRDTQAIGYNMFANIGHLLGHNKFLKITKNTINLEGVLLTKRHIYITVNNTMFTRLSSGILPKQKKDLSLLPKNPNFALILNNYNILSSRPPKVERPSVSRPPLALGFSPRPSVDRREDGKLEGEYSTSPPLHRRWTVDGKTNFRNHPRFQQTLIGSGSLVGGRKGSFAPLPLQVRGKQNSKTKNSKNTKSLFTPDKQTITNHVTKTQTGLTKFKNSTTVLVLPEKCFTSWANGVTKGGGIRQTNKWWSKKIISYVKPPFFDLHFKNPSYFYTYTAKTNYFTVSSQMPIVTTTKNRSFYPDNRSVSRSLLSPALFKKGGEGTSFVRLSRDTPLCLSTKFISQNNTSNLKNNTNKKILIIPKQPCLNISFSSKYMPGLSSTKKAETTDVFRLPVHLFPFQFSSSRPPIPSSRPPSIFDGEVDRSSIPLPVFRLPFGRPKAEVKNRGPKVDGKPRAEGLGDVYGKGGRETEGKRNGNVVTWTVNRGQKWEGHSLKHLKTRFLNNNYTTPKTKLYANYRSTYLIAQTNYFSPFEGELLYTKLYKNYLELNPYQNLQTGLIYLNSLTLNKTKEEKMRLAMFKYYLKTINKQNMVGCSGPRRGQKDWSRFNLILTKKDLMTLNYKNKVSDSQPCLNNMLQTFIKNKLKVQTITQLNKENHFNKAYNFNFKNKWLKQNLSHLNLLVTNNLITINFLSHDLPLTTRQTVDLNPSLAKKGPGSSDGFPLSGTHSLPPFGLRFSSTFGEEGLQSTSPPKVDGKTKTRCEESNILSLITLSSKINKVYEIKIAVPYTALKINTKIKELDLRQVNFKIKSNQSALANIVGRPVFRFPFGRPQGRRGEVERSSIPLPVFPGVKNRGPKVDGKLRAEGSGNTGSQRVELKYLLAQSGSWLENQKKGINYLFIPNTSVLNIKWTKFKQKTMFTKNKVGFFFLKGNTFFNSSNKLTTKVNNLFLNSKMYDINHSMNLAYSSFSNSWDKKKKPELLFGFPSSRPPTLDGRGKPRADGGSGASLSRRTKEVQTKNIFFEGSSFRDNLKGPKGQINFLHDTRYLSITSSLELEKIHINKNFLNLKPLLDKQNFVPFSVFPSVNPRTLHLSTLGGRWTKTEGQGNKYKTQNLQKVQVDHMVCGQKQSVCFVFNKVNLITKFILNTRKGINMTHGFKLAISANASLNKPEIHINSNILKVCQKDIFYFFKPINISSSFYVNQEIFVCNSQNMAPFSTSSFPSSRPPSIFDPRFPSGKTGEVDRSTEGRGKPRAYGGEVCPNRQAVNRIKDLCCIFINVVKSFIIFKKSSSSILLFSSLEINDFPPSTYSPSLRSASPPRQFSPRETEGRRWTVDGNTETEGKDGKECFGYLGTSNGEVGTQPSFQVIKKSGQLIHMNKQKITLRLGQPLVISPRSIIHASHGDFIRYKTAVITLTYQQLKTGDIVQGIPKIEQLFEARTTKRGRLFRDNVTNLLTGLFLNYFVKSTYLLRKNMLDITPLTSRTLGGVFTTSSLKQSLDLSRGESVYSTLHQRQTTDNLGLFVNNKQNQTIILALALQWSVKQSFYKIQQIIVDGILRVYRSQGVSIADKHVEIIVKQMTSKVRIINSNASKMTDYSFSLQNINRSLDSQREILHTEVNKSKITAGVKIPKASFGKIKSRTKQIKKGLAFENKLLEKLLSNKLDGPTGLFPGEIVDIDFVENINIFLLKTASLESLNEYSQTSFAIEPIKYEPIVLGITRASLEVESFLSAASFQQTTRVLSQAALYKKKDFLKGLKENIIIGNLIPAGTGYLSSLNF